MTEHRHDFDVPAAERCRLCGANDVDALVEQLAEDLWDSRRVGAMKSRLWGEAGSYWQQAFREMAATAVENLKRT